ncbi:MAG: hypothetical protein OD816_001221 [Thermodesulfobacterium sp.]|uniref:Uncharacterized protein n=1 Tax=Candidatus Thermodesulfobacterium syntrophicum TaxID=3060442 RepID=A0AAE3P6D3_9BACT|nr:hypothetical protein [Candidatus Thermodesulfobacterium syntrophicum]
MRRNLLVILCFFALFILPIKGVNAGRTSYVLMCKGGGHMELVICDVHIVLNGVDLGNSFIHAKGGKNAASPAPGECVWVDRGFRHGELCSGTNDIHLGVNIDINKLSDLKVSGNGRVSLRFRDNQANYLYDAIKNGKPFQLHVYRVSGCYFKVTKIGP